MIEVLDKASQGDPDDLLCRFAKERALHLALEAVTDVGSCLIDGFIMRDPSSYEDIIDIIHEEKVIDEELFPVLKALVRLRKPLVQDYYLQTASGTASIAGLSSALARFAKQVQEYLDRELAR
nr:HepT-like ribonuclease domain-containing protein [Paenibacillus caui]